MNFKVHNFELSNKYSKNLLTSKFTCDIIIISNIGTNNEKDTYNCADFNPINFI